MSKVPTDRLEAILDTLIPPSDDGRLPGAGAIGLAPTLLERMADVRAVIDQGMAVADACAGERGGADFAALSMDDRVAALRDVESREPAFIPSLLFHAYSIYYQNPRVQVALGLEPRPPHPKGYELEPGDFGALERVRARGRLYRET